MIFWRDGCRAENCATTKIPENTTDKLLVQKKILLACIMLRSTYSSSGI